MIIYLLNTHGVFLLIATVLFYLEFIEKSYEEVKHIILSSGITAVVCLLIKQILLVPRPYVVYHLEPLAGYSVRTASLPSLHAALAFALATTVILHQKKTGTILFLLAILISYGRVIAHVHYPADVLFGSVIGIIVALALEHVHFKA